MEQKTYEGKITLATNDPKEPSLTIPVHITWDKSTRNGRSAPLGAADPTRPQAGPRVAGPTAPAGPAGPAA